VPQQALFFLNDKLMVAAAKALGAPALAGTAAEQLSPDARVQQLYRRVNSQGLQNKCFFFG